MKFARIDTDDGVFEGEYDDGTVHTDEGSYEPAEYELLAPCEPSVFYCVGRNFGEKVDQMDYEVPEVPDFFIKPPVSLHDPETPIPYPSFSEELTYAGELAAVIDTECKNVAEDEVDDVVRGYTILNDLDCLDQERRTARKAFDSSGPLGPVVADIDPVGLDMTTHINGELRQEDNTENMFIKPREVISFLSERFTLKPDDVISFGSPANPGLLERGDEIEIYYEGIGTLRNTVGGD
ncbi:fumarylacetoacetase family protein [Natronomonas pharaonis DSM 2160]|uniref:Fumarylacetoacetase family protein n=1 Tax=Natronomonas pharaonis (strain ATCC 35678 / DSM 2160 / CIP 103997 / JCM 8858 / NBRC 14720 / NCIMB 2260 / Gabara) TaxID=348780 RepID=A0A1U7EWB2_NATPD|nr:fumarylacetoacetate hydrolase family protein [Natronomonas pharaonis]CAI49372.1 fumarylacetoacetase family protein [Natronomonas pharaonis DSM 2160]